MKNKLSLILGGLFLMSSAFLPAAARAATAFTVSATVPAASGISIVVDSVNAVGTPVFTPVSGTSLSFDPMTYNTTNNIWIPSIYYALNIGVSGGSGLPDTTVTYAEGTNPNGATNGLGFKTTATFDQELGTTETLLSLGKKRLIDLTGTTGHVPFTSLATGSYLRVYMGVWTGSTVAPADPSNGQPFSNADAAGTYTGTLTVSAVVN